MNISPELVAIAILGVSLVSLGWKVSSDIRRELKTGNPPCPRADVADLRGDCRRSQRTDRHGWSRACSQGFTGRELVDCKGSK